MTMKRRVLTTFKILAVTVTAAGCSRATAPEVRSEPVTAATSAPAEVPTAPALPAAETPAPSTTTPEQDPKLLALRDELDRLNDSQASQQKSRFRALCDADGYPLVGNVMRKGPSGAQPSFLCRLVRGGK
jgi:hypothetical protein